MRGVMTRLRDVFLSAALGLGLLTSAAQAVSAAPPAPADTQAIAQEAYVYALPMLANYKVMYQFAIDPKSGQYKAPFNQISNTDHVATPADTAVVTPNSDTPYSFAWLDLRAEPVVICVPAVAMPRYYSVQLVDMNTFNIGYIGSRATGPKAGCYMVAGPDWTGAKPKGIARIFPSESQFVLSLFRTQMFNPADMPKVAEIQKGYRVQPLSAFENRAPAPAPPPVAWPVPSDAMMKTDFIKYLNFILSYDPTVTAESALRHKFARIGIGAGRPFDFAALPDDQKAAMGAGINDAADSVKAKVPTIGKDENGWRVGAAFGDRAFYKGDYTLRAAAAAAGIYGNDQAEAFYPLLAKDSAGEKPDGSRHNYTLTFPAGELPPVNAFWSVTMYDGKTQLLIANPIDRYLINSPMLSGLKKTPDGSITLYVQKDSPGKALESNWLPAPGGPIYMVMRLYWPKADALAGAWKPPALAVAN